MDLTVDKLEQMFQNAEVTLDLMFRRMRWEIQQDDNGSFPVDPLLVLEELECVRGRVCVLAEEVCVLRERKRRLEDDIRTSLLKTAQLTHTHTDTHTPTDTHTTLPSVAALLSAAQEHTPDAPACRLECGPAAAQTQAQAKGGRPQSSAPPRGRGKRATSPRRTAGVPLRGRRPPM